MDVTGKRVSIIGAGKSGIAAAELLKREGAEVLLSELGRIGEKEVLSLQEKQIRFEEAGHSENVCDADFCIISPGIPPSALVVKTMQARGIPLYSEIEIASCFCKARIVGITGTDGKTTTATLVHRICEEDGLQQGYRSYSVGNIGVPFASMVREMNSADVAVVELSSYQLERCFTFRPDDAVLTNISPDHLDRYEHDMQLYADAKFRIFMNQSGNDTLVYNSDDSLLRAHFSGAADRFPFSILPFGKEPAPEGGVDRRLVLLDGDSIVVRQASGEERLLGTSEFLKKSFRGRHNISNVLAAVAEARALVSRTILFVLLSGSSGALNTVRNLLRRLMELTGLMIQKQLTSMRCGRPLRRCPRQRCLLLAEGIKATIMTQLLIWYGTRSLCSLQ